MLERSSYVPLYQQLKECLQSMIDQGELTPGDTLPSERQLSETYDVSSITIRRALAELTREGVVHRVRGKATYVSEPKIERDISQISGFTEDMLRAGRVPTMRGLEVYQESCSQRVAGRLGVQPNSEVTVVRRVRVVNAVTVALQLSYLPRHIGLLIKGDVLQHSSLYAVLKENLGIFLARAEETIDPIIIDASTSRVLNCQGGQVGFRLQRVTYDAEQRAVEYSDSIVRGDCYTLRMTMKDQRDGHNEIEHKYIWNHSSK